MEGVSPKHLSPRRECGKLLHHDERNRWLWAARRATWASLLRQSKYDDFLILAEEPLVRMRLQMRKPSSRHGLRAVRQKSRVRKRKRRKENQGRIRKRRMGGGRTLNGFNRRAGIRNRCYKCGSENHLAPKYPSKGAPEGESAPYSPSSRKVPRPPYASISMESPASAQGDG